MRWIRIAERLKILEKPADIAKQVFPAVLPQHLRWVDKQISDGMSEGRGQPHVGQILIQIPNGAVGIRLFLDTRGHAVGRLQKAQNAAVAFAMLSD
ncbi:MAG: hypothetical protein KatS3mg082_3277 [Nitrospiraceae bacterium]|nr:MAG: hypothetical protein KatS3mg082_3277 [Nitrospiraceae bacterium]